MIPSVARRWILLGVPVLALALAGMTRGPATRPAAAPPPVHHIFLIILENEAYDATFGPTSPAPYLAKTLPSRGVLLRNYYGIGHVSLDNYIALISGQAPNLATQRDCSIYTEFVPTASQLDADGELPGTGCVYPTSVQMLGDQLDSAGLTWRGYMEDLGNVPSRESAACGHPPIGAQDPTTHKLPNDQYATKHNPFYYFHTLIDDPARCADRVVNLSQLTSDLASVATTPNFSFITPNLCNDGHDAPCVDQAPGGLVQADTFLEHWVPIITSSPAYKADGVLLITFDEASSGKASDGEACCDEKGLPGQVHPPGYSGPGGGRIGAVILSPYARRKTISDVPYNHYSALRWIEDVFHLPHLGYAGAPHLATFGTDVFK